MLQVLQLTDAGHSSRRGGDSHRSELRIEWLMLALKEAI